MKRFSEVVAAIKAAYAGGDLAASAGDTLWLEGASSKHRNEQWERIVCYVVGGPIGPPANAAYRGGGEPSVIANRKPTVAFEIWARDFAAAENRLHAFIAAVYEVFGDSDDDISEWSEEWPQAQSADVTSGGVLVVVSFRANFEVLSTDPALVAYDVAYKAAHGGAPPNPGDPETPLPGLLEPTETVDRVAIKAGYSDAEILTLEKEDEST